MRGDYDPTNIKPIATKDLISWAYQVSIDLVSKLIDRLTFDTSVMRVGSDTFGNPIFQKGLQSQPSSLN